MNAKQTFLALGFSAMTVGLIALPGSSVRQPEPQEQGSPEARKQIVLDNPQHAKTVMSRDGDDDFQVFVTSGGGWLGAGISEVSADKVKELKLQAERGVVLGKIVPESPAAKAGLKESDVITEINGQHVEGTEQFRRMIHEIPSGRSVQFTVWRNGQSQTVNVTLGKAELRRDTVMAQAAPGNFAFKIPDGPDTIEMFSAPWGMPRTHLGIDAENLDGEFGHYFGAPDGEGILVRGVFPETPAAKAGLKVGDVITSVNGDRIRSVGELREKIAEKQKDKTVKLGVI
ncbi:MAG TPA: PDZ domain-containing protein, partial [Candidatus Acidoferrum sp.]|nr:PDZ domain-containing protein [Candidatus Acidoferrum sp.]